MKNIKVEFLLKQISKNLNFRFLRALTICVASYICIPVFLHAQEATVTKLQEELGHVKIHVEAPTNVLQGAWYVDVVVKISNVEYKRFFPASNIVDHEYDVYFNNSLADNSKLKVVVEYYYNNGWGGRAYYGSTESNQIVLNQNITLHASYGTKTGRVELDWGTPLEHTGVTGYTISRIRGDDPEIEIGSTDLREKTSFIDNEVIPGYHYIYKVTATGNPSYSRTGVGWSKPNGLISGYIKTPLNIAVGGVTIRAERQNVTDTIQSVYEAISSAKDGRYDIRNIYYGTEGDNFKVTPILVNHKFDPDTLTRFLDESIHEQSEVNFTDTTSLTVSGVVLQNGCPVEGVSVMAEGETMPYTTKSDGSYNLVVSQPGRYTIKASKKGHGFLETYNNVEILKNTSGLDFTDTSKVFLSGYFTASCNTYIGTATLRIFTDGACIDTTVVTNGSAYYELSLPTNKYNIELLYFESSNQSVLDSNDVKNYFNDIATIDLDSETVNDSASYNFTYRLPSSISVTFLDESKTCDGTTMVMKQNKTYDVVFKVEEVYNGNKCAVDTGFIVIEEELTSDQMIIDTIYFGGSVIDTMHMKTGIPNIISPYLNKFRATAHVGKNVSNVIDEDMLIVGHRPRTATFTTVSPSLPFLILHDPPGDGSFSFFEESTTYTNSFCISGSLEISAGVSAEVKAGLKLLKGQFVYSETEFALTISQSFGISIGMNSESTWDTEFSIAKGYSTSSDDGIVGEDGDLYVGGALNIIYAVTDVIEYDFDACETKLYQTLAIEPDGFATTFIYTENHITDVLIPSLEYISDLSPVTEKLKYDKQINEWKQVVENNHKNIEEALFKENISFSGGVEYTSSAEGSSTFTQAISTSLTIDHRTEVNVEFEESGSGATIGAELGMTIETGLSYAGSESKSTSTGFTLTDDDDGDYQSVDILIDQVYGTPAFNVVAGTTSCPWEDSTQAREGVRLRANKYYETLADPDGEAVFVLELANTSESNEDNTYNLIFDATSNPFGALITIGGSPVIGNIPTPYDIPAGESVMATVTVKKAPHGNVFNNLRFILESDCDGSISDEILINVEFETNCGDIVLTPEQPQPLINSTTSNNININVSDYTKDNLTSITIERRIAYDGWETIHILTGDAIEETSTDITVSFDNVPDGIYFVRAVANCSDASVISDDIEVIKDKLAPIATMVNPLDFGTLEPGDVIYALFNEDIQTMEPSDISILNRTTGNTVSFQYGVTYKKLILLPDMAHINDGDTLEVAITNIKDVYGNSTEEDSGPSWSFAIPDVEGVFNDPNLDIDRDGVIDANDICVFQYNPGQEDMDTDGIGDACDDDIDGDGILNTNDNCSITANAAQSDDDGDGIGNNCDDDVDGDGVVNDEDNCSTSSNINQADTDIDGIGDVCDDDIDGDGINNTADNCIYTPNVDQADANSNGIGDACEEASNRIKENQGYLTKLEVYPNPFADMLTFEIRSSKATNGILEVLDVTGKYTHISQNVSLLAGENRITIDTNELIPGIYVYKLKFNDNIYVNRVVK